MISRTRVVIADDDARVRQDFSMILGLEPDIEVVAVAGDGLVASTACELHNPDVVVMDIRMPKIDGIEVTRRIKANPRLNCNVLVVTTFDLDDYVLGAVRAGAGGFMLKDQAPESLATAVRTVAAGDGMVSPRATALLLRQFVEPNGKPDPALTPRELDLIKLLARGLSNDEIATTAFISRATVKTHISSILAKLNLESRIQIVVWAYERGLAESSRPAPPR